MGLYMRWGYTRIFTVAYEKKRFSQKSVLSFFLPNQETHPQIFLHPAPVIHESLQQHMRRTARNLYFLSFYRIRKPAPLDFPPPTTEIDGVAFQNFDFFKHSVPKLEKPHYATSCVFTCLSKNQEIGHRGRDEKTFSTACIAPNQIIWCFVQPQPPNQRVICIAPTPQISGYFVQPQPPNQRVLCIAHGVIHQINTIVTSSHGQKNANRETQL